MNRHDHALVILRNALEEAEGRTVVQKELLDEWVELRDYRCLQLLDDNGSAEKQVRLNKEQYVMLRLKVLALKNSIETLERDGA